MYEYAHCTLCNNKNRRWKKPQIARKKNQLRLGNFLRVNTQMCSMIQEKCRLKK